MHPITTHKYIKKQDHDDSEFHIHSELETENLMNHYVDHI